MTTSTIKNTVTPLTVNIYGNSAAGKTRFLYELLRQLRVEAERLKKDVKFNENALNFFLKIQERIRLSGDCIATSGEDVIENITVEIPNDFFSPDGTGLLIIQSWSPTEIVKFIFQDVEGEKIRRIVDQAQSNPDEERKVTQLLRSCAFLLCFFDPTYSDMPASVSDEEKADKIRKFYEAELKRMKTLVRKVPEARKSDPLPILFIQTHKDILENMGDARKQEAANWFDQVHEYLRAYYEDKYGKKTDGNPRVDRELLDRKTNYFLISSIETDDVFAPFKRLGEIQDAVRPTIVKEKYFILKNLLSPKVFLPLLALALVFIAGIAGIVHWDNSRKDRREAERITYANAQNANEIISSIEQRIESLKGISTTKKSGPKELDDTSRTLREAFDKLVSVNIENTPEPEKERVKKSLADLEAAIAMAVQRIARACCDLSDEHDRKIELTRLLAGLKPNERERLSPSEQRLVDEAMNQIWDSVLSHTKTELRRTIKGIRKVPSALPADDVNKIKACLEVNQARWNDLKRLVPMPGEMKVIDEISDVIKFCEACSKVYLVSETGLSGNIYADGTYFTITLENQRDSEGGTENERKPFRRVETGQDRSIKKIKDPVPYRLPLDKRVAARIAHGTTRADLYRQGLSIQENAGSLDFLGMPLIGREKKVTAQASNEALNIELTFTHDYALPDWFWDSL